MKERTGGQQTGFGAFKLGFRKSLSRRAIVGGETSSSVDAKVRNEAGNGLNLYGSPHPTVQQSRELRTLPKRENSKIKVGSAVMGDAERRVDYISGSDSPPNEKKVVDRSLYFQSNKPRTELKNDVLPSQTSLEESGAQPSTVAFNTADSSPSKVKESSVRRTIQEIKLKITKNISFGSKGRADKNAKPLGQSFQNIQDHNPLDSSNVYGNRERQRKIEQMYSSQTSAMGEPESEKPLLVDVYKRFDVKKEQARKRESAEESKAPGRANLKTKSVLLQQGGGAGSRPEPPESSQFFRAAKGVFGAKKKVFLSFQPVGFNNLSKIKIDTDLTTYAHEPLKAPQPNNFSRKEKSIYNTMSPKNNKKEPIVEVKPQERQSEQNVSQLYKIGRTDPKQSHNPTAKMLQFRRASLVDNAASEPSVKTSKHANPASKNPVFRFDIKHSPGFEPNESNYMSLTDKSCTTQTAVEQASKRPLSRSNNNKKSFRELAIPSNNQLITRLGNQRIAPRNARDDSSIPAKYDKKTLNQEAKRISANHLNFRKIRFCGSLESNRFEKFYDRTAMKPNVELLQVPLFKQMIEQLDTAQGRSENLKMNLEHQMSVTGEVSFAKERFVNCTQEFNDQKRNLERLHKLMEIESKIEDSEAFCAQQREKADGHRADIRGAQRSIDENEVAAQKLHSQLESIQERTVLNLRESRAYLDHISRDFDAKMASAFPGNENSTGTDWEETRHAFETALKEIQRITQEITQNDFTSENSSRLSEEYQMKLEAAFAPDLPAEFSQSLSVFHMVYKRCFNDLLALKSEQAAVRSAIATLAATNEQLRKSISSTTKTLICIESEVSRRAVEIAELSFSKAHFLLPGFETPSTRLQLSNLQQNLIFSIEMLQLKKDSHLKRVKRLQKQFRQVREQTDSTFFAFIESWEVFNQLSTNFAEKASNFSTFNAQRYSDSGSKAEQFEKETIVKIGKLNALFQSLFPEMMKQLKTRHETVKSTPLLSEREMLRPEAERTQESKVDSKEATRQKSQSGIDTKRIKFDDFEAKFHQIACELSDLRQIFTRILDSHIIVFDSFVTAYMERADLKAPLDSRQISKPQPLAFH